MQIGQLNALTIVDIDSSGLYLDGGIEGDIPLSRAEVPPDVEIGQKLEVFVYPNSEDFLVATRIKPIAVVGEFAVLKVVSINQVGAFLDWGLPKDLLLPYAEQTKDLRPGEKVVVFIYLDNSDRVSASMRLQRHIDKQPAPYGISQEVDLLVVARTDLGFKALINQRHFGMLYADEVFQQLHYAERLRGFIKAIRPDGKIDLALNRPGHRAATDDIAPVIMEKLRAKNGFLPLNDKSSAEKVHAAFGVSRKKFKIALGALYKQRLITVEDDGIRLVVD